MRDLIKIVTEGDMDDIEQNDGDDLDDLSFDRGFDDRDDYADHGAEAEEEYYDPDPVNPVGTPAGDSGGYSSQQPRSKRDKFNDIAKKIGEVGGIKNLELEDRKYFVSAHIEGDFQDYLEDNPGDTSSTILFQEILMGVIDDIGKSDEVINQRWKQLDPETEKSIKQLNPDTGKQETSWTQNMHPEVFFNGSPMFLKICKLFNINPHRITGSLQKANLMDERGHIITESKAPDMRSLMESVDNLFKGEK